MLKKSKYRSGFSLILTLTVMAMLLLCTIVTASFISIEARMATQSQQATRAKLNAIVALKLAVAHLQQEAGPDRRSTARADITQPGVLAANLKNPMWTGVWRSDFPDSPPAWLVSGRHDYPGSQSVTLGPAPGEAITFLTAGVRPYGDYPLASLAPWQTDYTPPADRLVDLVGFCSSAPATATKPSGQVTLPKVDLPGPTVAGDTIPTDTTGTYAYWIGDEGLKARINLLDPRTVATANTLGNLLALRSPMNAGYSLLTGMGAVSLPAELPRIDATRNINLLTGFDQGTATILNSRQLFHDVSTSSSGVIADSYNGALKRDLSLAFEKPDADFARTEFGGGAAGAAATLTEKGYGAVAMTIPMDNSTITTAPIFNRTTADGNVRGPTWWALRDFHRLYKQVGWNTANTPSLRARTFYPNVGRVHPSPAAGSDNNIRNRIYSFSDVYNGDQPTPFNPNATDLAEISGNANRVVPRPINCAATPYVHRVTLIFSVNYWNGGIWLNITPIVVLHNPYNVSMTWSPTQSGTGEYAMALSFTEWNDWNFRYRQYANYGAGAMTEYNIKLSEFFKLQDLTGRANDKDMFRIYLPSTFTIAPGEYRVFSCPAGMTNWKQAVTLNNTFNTTGGFNDDLNQWGFGDDSGWYWTDAFGFTVTPATTYRVRHTMACWPGDRINDTETTFNFYYKNSEHTELVQRGLDPTVVGTPPEKFFNNYSYINPKFFSNGVTPREPSIVSAIEMSAKTADWTASPFPTFTHSNPMAATIRADGAGRKGTGSAQGLNGASPSYRTRVWTPASWPEVIQTASSGAATYGGYTLTSSGTMTKSIHTEIPLFQPTSLAQYAHANFGVRDQQPLLSIGNSFANPLVKSDRVLQDNGPNWTEYDQTYLLNTALWDGFFLSGSAPRMTISTTPAEPQATDPTVPPGQAASGPNPTAAAGLATAQASVFTNPGLVEQKPLIGTTSSPGVLDDFIADVAPLDNPRMHLHRNGQSSDTLFAALQDYRRSSSVLLNDGAFNVNSTSVEAWTALLGSAKKMAIGSLTSTLPATASARFPRGIPTGTATPATSANMTDAANWNGFVNLTDAQIVSLAKAIVAENKSRFTILTRSERELGNSLASPAVTTPMPRLFRGLSQATTPYLGLSEFVNRFLTPSTWASRCGTIQAAILRSDQTDNLGLSDRLTNSMTFGKITQADLAKPAASFASNPENIELTAQTGTSRTHTAFGAAGNLIQSDVLALLGPALATRSDTFTIRCYGEAGTIGTGMGRSWIEAVVQRIPDFIDSGVTKNTNAPETGSAAPKPSATTSDWDATPPAIPALSNALTPLNHALGRRFKIINVRWLKPDEV